MQIGWTGRDNGEAEGIAPRRGGGPARSYIRKPQIAHSSIQKGNSIGTLTAFQHQDNLQGLEVVRRSKAVTRQIFVSLN